ncbi:PLC-like phosphodiesterase [Staphylotrichum tortipilum]|uniref:PLC-like phosphodiesterase n=1 Tax=Staphylotrichum tortipilum TaxID=2831512 RepID=A0AAN6MIF2_9PEZI|nr:PLC-like phosphodiesterase [Staphylotrichum longicolle]
MSPEETPLLRDKALPRAVVNTTATASAGPSPGPQLPLNIGHRGYKAAFPENSMPAFEGAVAAGAHALETDVHLSRDGVVVLSHDPTLKRCFALDARIADCDWAYLSTLQSVREPRAGMPRLADLLVWLGGDAALDAVWVLLDIKTDDDPELLLPAIARTIEGVGVREGAGWKWRERVMLGGWNETYINHARLHLPNFPLAYIGFSLPHAYKFLSDDQPGVHFNLLQATQVGPLGARFRREARRRGRRIFVWTVNDEGWMEWCVRKGLDGVITDDVGRFGEVRDRFLVAEEEAARGGVSWPRTIKLYAKAILLQGLALVFSVLLWHRLSGRRGKSKSNGRAEADKP